MRNIVAHYVDWSPKQDLFCTLDGTHKSYCTPESYKGQSPTLFRNRGDGTFEDVTARAGLKDPTCKALGNQLLRAGTSVGANYRAVCRAKSNADFISKFGNVEEEADESFLWLDLLVEAGKLSLVEAAPLLQEADELTAIAVSSINTARKSGRRP